MATETQAPTATEAQPQTPVAAPSPAPSRPPPCSSAASANTSIFNDPGGPRYQVAGIIGSGGMGVVLAADQTALQRQVAIKRCTASDIAARVAFHAEARCLAALDHPHVVPVYDAGDDFFVMRKIAGQGLDVLIARGGLSTAGLVEIVLKVCDAMTMAHSRGVMHRDLKGENVMVGEHGEVFVVDWGLALAFAPDHDGRWLAPRLSAANLCAGTPGCLPPELALGERELVGPASDVFQLGALLWHGVTGRLPYDCGDAFAALCAASQCQRQQLADAVPQSPPRLRQAIEQAMHQDPAQRGSAEEFRAALRAWLRNSAAEEHAANACTQGLALLDHRDSASRDGYARLGQALMLIDQACAQDPRPEYQQARIRAVQAFAHVAIRHGDIHLARAMVTGQLPSGVVAALLPQQSAVLKAQSAVLKPNQLR